MTTAVKISNLKKYYGKRLVLDIPRLTLEKGKCYGIIGSNGCGKTTLLRIIAGVLSPDEGQVTLMPGNLGYMPQKPYGFGFSVIKNVALAVRDSDKRNAREKAYKALEKVGLSRMCDAKGNRLSGGETQRMAFARILADHRDLVLMDEPTASMDVEASAEIEIALFEYLRYTGCTLLYTTHIPSQAASLAEEIILLNEGRIVEQGPAKQVLYNPQSKSGQLFLSHWRLT